MDIHEHARLHDDARERALALRQAAIAQAWDWLGAQCMRPAARAERAARRWAQRLRRHQEMRADAGAPACRS
ncbi:hypothetical protein KAK06_00025 [Ideonella sp. 4Y11]|uniref:Uncharacterized protein n=1 Tax=Ideonella aquatica TaxID=2824119 RepID=A0A941BJC7_9BURK|nr:hypothetical protein [Ideonella aquatica]MBQ0957329.1 hypothetical protein [Ideonella aquatica]